MHFSDRYEFLSNFYPASVKIKTLDGEVRSAPTVEHAYQALKADTLRGQLKILDCATPGQAKRAGNSMTMRADWLVVREDIMYKLILQKFRYHSDLAQRLIAVTEPIVEHNTWHDNTWGICVCNRLCPGYGSNRLGKLLTKVRETLL